jgi:hypothetical protein
LVLVVNERSLGGEDWEASREASHRVDAVRVIEEAVVGEVVSLGRVPLCQDALVGIDEVLDVGFLHALLVVARDEVAGCGGGRAGGEGEGTEETHLALDERMTGAVR